MPVGVPAVDCTFAVRVTVAPWFTCVAEVEAVVLDGLLSAKLIVKVAAH